MNRPHTWGSIFDNALRRGQDHGYAAYLADNWETRKMRKGLTTRFHDGSWWAYDPKHDSDAGPYSTEEQAQDWIDQIKSTSVEALDKKLPTRHEVKGILYDDPDRRPKVEALDEKGDNL